MTTATTIATEPVVSPRVRASNDERHDTATRLHQALGEGRLDLVETEERVTAAYAAQYRDELPPLLADLPAQPSVASLNSSAIPTWDEVWSSAVWRIRATVLGAAAERPPTAAQSRATAILIAVALLWTVACAFLGAGLVH